MSEPTRSEKCAALAMAMGWTSEIPNGFSLPEWVSHFGESRQFAPNPYESAADSRALVAWLATCGSRVQLSFVYVITGRRDGYHYGNIIEALTAPLPVIADAAYAAIQGEKSK